METRSELKEVRKNLRLETDRLEFWTKLRSEPEKRGR